MAAVVSFLLFVAAGLVRRPGGFVIGSVDADRDDCFGFVEPSFFIIGAVLIGSLGGCHRCGP